MRVVAIAAEECALDPTDWPKALPVLSSTRAVDFWDRDLARKFNLSRALGKTQVVFDPDRSRCLEGLSHDFTDKLAAESDR